VTEAEIRQRQPRRSIEVRREQVLDAALELILEDGYAALTMEALARRVDIAKPVVYKAYPHQAAVLMALLDREEQRTFEQLAEALPEVETGDVVEDVMAWGERLMRLVLAHPDTWRLMLLPPQGTPDVVAERIEGGRDVIRAQVRSMITPRSAVEGFDVDLTAQALVAVTERLGTLMLDDPERYPVDRILAFARGVLEVVLVDLRP